MKAGEAHVTHALLGNSIERREVSRRETTSHQHQSTTTIPKGPQRVAHSKEICQRTCQIIYTSKNTHDSTQPGRTHLLVTRLWSEFANLRAWKCGEGIRSKNELWGGRRPGGGKRLWIFENCTEPFSKYSYRTYSQCCAKLPKTTGAVLEFYETT